MAFAERMERDVSTRRNVQTTILLVEDDQPHARLYFAAPMRGARLSRPCDGIDAPGYGWKHNGRVDLLLSDVENATIDGR